MEKRQTIMSMEDQVQAALIVANQLGLEPNTPLGECYLIPYGNECTFQLGYKGLLTLAKKTVKPGILDEIER